MSVRVFTLFFRQEGGITFPADAQLHRLAVEFCETELADKVNLADFQRVWVACEVDAEDKPTKATGVLGMVLKPDFPVFRFTDAKAVKSLVDRANDYLHEQGWRGQEAFVRVAKNEKPEQRCPDWEAWLVAFGAEDAERYKLTVK